MLGPPAKRRERLPRMLGFAAVRGKTAAESDATFNAAIAASILRRSQAGRRRLVNPDPRPITSGLPQSTDILTVCRRVSKVPGADKGQCLPDVTSARPKPDRPTARTMVLRIN